MKIAQFINTVDDGGAETLILALTEDLIKRGHEVKIIAFEDSWILNRANELKLPTIALGSEFQKNHSIYKLPMFGWKLHNILKHHKIEVLHSHVYGATLRGAAAAWYAGIPHFATQHDTHSVKDKKSRVSWMNVCGKLDTRFVMISNQMLKYYVERGLKHEYCHKIYNGVDNANFNMSTNSEDIQKLKTSLQINNEIVFVSVGRLRPIKGFEDLIRAFRMVNDSINFRLIIVGDGPLQKELEDKVQKSKLQDKVIFTGAVNNVYDYLKIADVFVLASHNEGLPCSIIEAMLCALPIIATDVGGNKELIKTIGSTANGILVPAFSPNILTCALEHISNMDRRGRKLMGTCSYQKAMEGFTLKSMTNKYENLFSTSII